MIVRFHKNFEKAYGQLTVNQKKKAKDRLSLFLKDEFDTALNNHPLRGKYNSYRSINISGDLRAIYKRASKETRIFVILGRHSKLYK